MTVPLTLIAVALLVSLTAPTLLAHASWPYRTPRLGILAWQSAVVTVITAGVLLAVTALAPVERISFDLGHLLHACPEQLRRRYQFLHGTGVPLVSLAIASGVAFVVFRATVVQARSVRRSRQRQRELLRLLSPAGDPNSGTHVIDFEIPLAYCVPGDGGRIVLTSATLAALSEDQLSAVLAHERAHLNGRHDVVLFGADVAATAFPRSRFFRRARRELHLLVEMLADDMGARGRDRHHLATALVSLGEHASPQGSLGAQGDTLARVERLLHEPMAASRLRGLIVAAFACALVASPWIIAVAPALAARSGLCPLPS